MVQPIWLVVSIPLNIPWKQWGIIGKCGETVVYIYIYISGWWFHLYLFMDPFISIYGWLVVSTYPSEKCDGVKVSWDDDIPNIWKVVKFMFQTTNQQ